MYRKELKGWNRNDGIVKEDSEFLTTVDNIIPYEREAKEYFRCDSLYPLPSFDPR